ncbi:hypothetical protein SLNWT_0336 [Streptomyces albus]|uniref:Proline rich protein membrane protein n=2 Tax=Streptomyces albus subsp. albus TaxID=67257 RepID=A0A0B5ERD3_STRA4|nr:hypothetical protein SLNWT_0336 [Streptomyces albus]AOU75023.1 hypothetical protein SLNHY_0332 [Streptomyces albus]AYN30831.1 hypothetical protein DUI70_0328 [Streptomyces albus]CCD31834.1 hypothetical protein [Streptomyces albus subsp. albus]
MRTIRGLWRWRGNPLWRRTDRIEGWAALATLLCVLLGAPLVGVVSGTLCHQALLDAAREQRAQRKAVTAVVIRPVRPASFDTDPETAPVREGLSRAVAKWTAPDGTSHTGAVKTYLRTPRTGDRFRIWTDKQGRPVTRPMNRAAAATHSVLAGFGGALATAGAAEGTRQLVMWRLVRRRHAEWDRAWDKAGPDWGRTGTGS